MDTQREDRRRPVADRPSLVCIGNITVDESVRPDGARREALGGDALFAVLAARSVAERIDCSWLAPVGHDFPESLREQLQRAGLGLDHLPRRDQPTVRNVVTYDAAGGRVWDLTTGREHFDRMSVYPADVSGRHLTADGVLVLAMSLRSQLALTPWLGEQSDAVIYLDLEEDGVPGHESEIGELIRACDVFLPSEVEARMLAGTADMPDAARHFAELGPPCVVIKLAERGCLVLEAGQLTEVPTTPVEPVDPTGAGDAFCGAFAAAHLERGDAVVAARAAAGAAALAISGFGVEALLADAIRRRGAAAPDHMAERS